MKLNDYQKMSKRTMPEGGNPPHYKFKEVVSNYAMGLAGETGEVVDLLKKHLHHGHPLDRDALLKELGDGLHYLSGVATLFGFTLEEVATANLEKLMKRYPDGFNSEASINRTE